MEVLSSSYPIMPAKKAEAEAAPMTSPIVAEIAFLDTTLKAPFDAIGELFDFLRSDASSAKSLNDSYPSRGVFKTAAFKNPACDQKLTIDLSPIRLGAIPTELVDTLKPHGFSEVVDFFTNVMKNHYDQILDQLNSITSLDLKPLHRSCNVNFRLCDYTPDTAAPTSDNGCGAHRDYGTFSIIFQDGSAGLEIEDPGCPGRWLAVPADKVVVLAGWCAFVISGGVLRAVRHRVRRQPGVRRLSAVLFVAPDLDVILQPIPSAKQLVRFSGKVLKGEINVKWFKEIMGMRWRAREGNEKLEDGANITQDQDIEQLLLA